MKVVDRTQVREPLILIGMGLIFGISRILYGLSGVQFDTGTVWRNWHFIDPQLLISDLWRSVFYMHTQPPLMNLLTGIGLQLFPESWELVARGVFLLGGYLLMVSIYLVGKKLGLPGFLSVGLAIWFSISPATVLYENRLIYAHPMLLFLVLGAVFFAAVVEHRRTRDVVLFSICLAVMALTWGLFHLVWMLVCFGIAAYMLRKDRLKVLWLLPAFLLVFAWYAKNGILYGSFTASTWSGLNLFKIVTIQIPGEVREGWIEENLVSELSLVPPYRSPEVYLDYFPDTPLTGIPLLDDYVDSTGYRNQHHLSYVYAGERYLSDAVRMILIAPGYYLNSVNQSVYIFFHSASDYPHLRGRNQITRLDSAWNRLFHGQWKQDEDSAARIQQISLANVGWWLVASYLVVLVAVPLHIWREQVRLDSPPNALILFMYWNILFVSAAGILLDIGENNRTRFAIDPFLFLLFLYFFGNWIRSMREKLGNRQVLNRNK